MVDEIEKPSYGLPPMNFEEWYYTINKKLDRIIKALESIGTDALRVKGV